MTCNLMQVTSTISNVQNLDIFSLISNNVVMTVDKDKMYGIVIEKIRQLRKFLPDGTEREQRITQEDLAGLIGVPRTTITNVENGRQQPSLHLIYNLCQAFDIELMDLIPPVSEVTSNIDTDKLLSVIVAGTDLQDEWEEKLVSKVEKALRK